MNIELLRKVVEHVEQEPRRFNMETWYQDVSSAVGSENEDWVDNLNADVGVAVFSSLSDIPPCGAVGCLAGNACIIGGAAKPLDTVILNGIAVTNYLDPDGGWFDSAQELLDLTHDQSCRLFYPNADFAEKSGVEYHWPEPFASEYTANALNPDARAKILKARVEHFIATEGRE